MSHVDFSVRNAIGEIVRIGNCPEVDWSAQASKPGEVVVLGRGDQQTQWINPVTDLIEMRELLFDVITFTQEELPEGGIRATLTGLPPNTTVVVNEVNAGTFTPDETGALQFEFRSDGVYALYCASPSFYPHRYFVEVELLL